MAKFPDSSHSEQVDPINNEDPIKLYQIEPDFSIFDFEGDKGEYMHLISRDQLPGILRGIHEQKRELQTQIHEMQTEDLDIIEGLTVTTKQISPMPLVGCGTRDMHDKMADILVSLELRKTDVIYRIERCLIKYDVIKEILDVVDELPNDQRRIIKSLFFDGITQADIAKELNVDRTTVYRKLQVALDTLYDLLTNTGDANEQNR